MLVDKTLQQFFNGETGERQLYQQALSAFQRGEDENMAKICEAYMLAQEAMFVIFGCHGLVKSFLVGKMPRGCKNDGGQ